MRPRAEEVYTGSQSMLGLSYLNTLLLFVLCQAIVFTKKCSNPFFSHHALTTWQKHSKNVVVVLATSGASYLTQLGLLCVFCCKSHVLAGSDSCCRSPAHPQSSPYLLACLSSLTDEFSGLNMIHPCSALFTHMYKLFCFECCPLLIQNNKRK